MKWLIRVLIALFMAIIMAATLPVQVFAESNEEKYISEVQIGVGKSSSDAEKALDGYEILKDDSGNYADLNQKAGASGIGSKGERVVYMGIKRTKNRAEAITDLAVMNMKGGYSVEDYEALMEKQMSNQIIPFVNGFLAVIEEYRANYNSSFAANKERAKYIHDMLNKLRDDDCGGAGLGDLLLNETKFEMGDKAYDALSETEKNKHADILTIIAQSNGNATLMLENLLTRAADTSEDTWIDRFVNVTYDDLVDKTELTPSKANKLLAKQYDDKANEILNMWDGITTVLSSYDEYMEFVQNFDFTAYKKAMDRVAQSYDSATDEEKKEMYEALADEEVKFYDAQEKLQYIAIHDKLENTEYDGGTLLDFFSADSEEIEENITVLYPLVASLSDGQKAGLEFLTLTELIASALTDNQGYKSAKTDIMKETSIYEGVNREIYEEGGVALTSDALRTDALLKQSTDDSLLSGWTIASYVVTSALAASLVYTAIRWKFLVSNKTVVEASQSVTEFAEELEHTGYYDDPINGIMYDSKYYEQKILANNSNPDSEIVNIATANSRICKYLTIGFSVAVIIMISISIYLTYRDMVNRYKVNYTPIPRFIIDEKDLIGYNSKGEKIVLKNQAAYYKAVFCNRKAGDEYYKTVGNVADLNGDVGQQWLALYAERNEAEAPILADSFICVKNTEIPSGYKTGIHMFGTQTAENLNNPLYVWNSSAPNVYVYFKTEEAVASTAGSNFTLGSLAITGSAGIALGAAVTALGIKVKKRKGNQNITA